ncbi:glycosyltransferase WbuB [Niabella ginsenosidivorans]|uniref:Glycosyltransferase WbuB n=1 Tax=Niabella ginsenosidivorans TaxID=1176587 RepID=A0A1A9HZX6_9BACT|nr:glycosyltransferase WbuB [Niabella ginsenosidivorans]
MNEKKILIHSIAFSPDGVSTAYLYNDIAIALKNAGYEVVVLTTTPHYNIVPAVIKKQPLSKHLLGLYYTSEYNGIKVLHVTQKKFKSTILRMLGFVYWHTLSLILGLKEKRIDLILSPSPPLSIGFINLIIGRLKKAKVIYNVQEIYPDFLIEQGNLKSGIIIRFLKWLERFVYNKSDAVTTIDQIFYNIISPRFVCPKKLHIIPNFVDTALYRPLSKETIKLCRDVFKNSNALKVMYAGNIGHAQDWDPLIQAALYLKDDPIEFYVIGEGVMKEYLSSQVKTKSLNKVHVLPYQPRELMPHLLAFSDIQFIFMSKEMENHGFPSKVYTIMASAKPLLVCSGEQTPIVNFLSQFTCAKLITTNDNNNKINEITSFLKTISKDELKKMGENGFNEVQKNYSKEAVSQQYIQLVQQLLN